MSWFQDIAGKAENLLNAMDKGAASALSNVQSNLAGATTTTTTTSAHSSRRVSVKSNEGSSNGTFTYDTEFIDSPEIMSLKTSPSSSSLQSGNGNGSKSTSGTSHKRTLSNDSNGSSRASGSSKQIDDDKLIEFLNKNDADLAEEDWNASSAHEDAGSDRSSSHSQADDSHKVSQVKIEALSKELAGLNKRYSELAQHNKQLQRKAIGLHNQNVNNDKLVRDLRSKEIDLIAMIETKDSQFEALRMQLDQSTLELKQKTTELEQQQQRIAEMSKIKGSTEEVEKLERELANVNKTLNEERQELRRLQELNNQQIARLEDNQRSLMDELENVQRTLAETRNTNFELELQRATIAKKFESLETEFGEFKLKANKTLEDKNELIRVLGDKSNKHNEANGGDDEHIRLLQAQADALLEETTDLRAKLQETTMMLDKAHNQTIPRQEHEIQSLKERLAESDKTIETLKLDVRHLSEEQISLQDDFNQIRSSLTTRIAERDEEIEKLRRQLTVRRESRHVNKPSEGSLNINMDEEGGDGRSAEWEHRLKSLTENLIQKQSVNEQLASANHSLKLQLERSEAKLRELATDPNAFNNDVAIGIYHSPSFTNLIKHRMTSNVGGNSLDDTIALMEDDPNDGQVTRKVKRAYGAIDAFSIRLGRTLRVHPSARAMFLVYVVVLHLWVFFVLLYYEPEIHNKTSDASE